MKSFYEAVKDRRSRYSISGESTVSDDRITEIVNNAVLEAPSSFNSQSARVAVLFGENHKKLWDMVMETLRLRVPADKFGPTEKKVKSFAAGYGTVLFFEDQAVVRKLEEQFPSYKDNFSLWSYQSSGMLQYMVWTWLAAEGMGASLQHYNPIIDDKVREAFSIPDDWKLISQMPFGRPTAPAPEKRSLPLEGRVKIFK